MFDNQRIIAVIPARGGSKGIKNKNIIDLCGKPLLAYTVEAALQCKYIDDVVVSTDSDQIASVAKQYGAEVPFIRPLDLASDTAKTIDVILHCIKQLANMRKTYDVLVLLQPTQPLRTVNDIDGAIETFYKNKQEALASISEIDDHPLLTRYIDRNGRLEHLINGNSTCRRQDMPLYYKINGCIYINNVSDLNEETSFNDNPVPYVMDRTHSVDIDEMADLYLAQYFLSVSQA